MRVLIVCVVLFVFGCNLNGQSYLTSKDIRLRHFQVKDGLPSNSVQSILQDQQGFIWLGTQIGLVRFDGYEFSLLKLRDDENSPLLQSSIWALHEDKNGCIWVGTFKHGAFRYNPKTGDITGIPHLRDHQYGLPHEQILDIDQDQLGVIWMTTPLGLSSIKTVENYPDSFHIQNFKLDSSDQSLGYAALLTDTTGRTWVGTNRGLYSFQGTPRDQIDFTEHLLPGYVMSIRRITYSNKMKLVMSTQLKDRSGRWNPAIVTTQGQEHSIYWLPNYFSTSPYSILMTDDGTMWLGTRGQGVYRINPSDIEMTGEQEYQITKAQQYLFGSIDDFAVGNNFVNTIYSDQSGSIWIGNWLQGLYQISPAVNQFKHIKLPEPQINPNKSVYAVLEKEKGQFWISSYLNGLIQYNAYDFSFKYYGPGTLNSVGSNTSMDLIIDRQGQLWTLGGDRWLHLFDASKQDFAKYQLGNELFDKGLFPAYKKTSHLHGICEDRDGHFWIGSNGLGIFHFDPERRQVMNHYPHSNKRSEQLGLFNNVLRSFCDSRNNVWFSFNGFGLHKLIIASKDSVSFESCTPTINTIYSIAEDAYGKLWLGTLSDGLVEYDAELGILNQFSSKDGLPHENIQHIIPDGDKLWLITPNGLGRFDLTTRKCTKYGSDFGLEFEQRLMNKGSQGQSGIAIGTTDGFYLFNPDLLNLKAIPPETKFLRLSINHDRVLPNSEWIEFDLPYINDLRLKSTQNNVSIEYAGIYYDNPIQLRYAYFLEGLHEDWIEVGSERIARFSNLPAGDYNFSVRSAIGTGRWGPSSLLRLKVLPPWYASNLALLLYFIGLAFALYGIHRFQLKRKLQLAETKRLKELDGMKSRFYTNLTHELRTPLTVISGMAKEVLQDPKSWFREGLEMIIRNSEKVHQTINQMLKLSKLESGSLPLNPAPCNVNELVNYIVQSFSSYAKQRDIRMHVMPSSSGIIALIDHEKLGMILSNLLANAIKFTSTGGDIYVSCKLENEGPQPISIEVRDAGIGIPEKDLPFVFDRFYQADQSEKREFEGTGIGLALTKELVHLLDGKIEVQSKESHGSTFKISLPHHRVKDPTVINEISRSQVNFAIPISGNQLVLQQKPAASNAPIVLIVEDNQDIQQYISACLVTNYTIRIADDGEQGLKMAIDEIPDVVISDIMMPKMDGFELCSRLKEDNRTSHIPIILLTAKADHESRLEGLKLGADAYLIKPFDKSELLIRIDKLMDLRKRLQQKYMQPNSEKANLVSAKHEDDFLYKVNELLETNLDNEHFGIPELCRLVGVSRVQLHRKLKALTDLSASHYIRRYKLEKSRTILDQSTLTVSQVAYAVGFKNPNYFSKVFNETYGIPPTIYRNRKSE